MTMNTRQIPSPLELKTKIPLPQSGQTFIDQARNHAIDILEGKQNKLILIIGPCSIHDQEQILEYAEKLQNLSQRLPSFFPILRVFVEKPRTRHGWKGFVYDPHLDGSYDITYGLETSRQILKELTALQMPCAMELLEPLTTPYFEDLLTWGVIGARTSSSQVHRQLASSLCFPVGFKNSVHGEIDVAIHGQITAQEPHSFLHIDPYGHICLKQSLGNPLTHLVLRGSDLGTNYDSASIASACRRLQEEKLQPRLLIDCSHGNSRKNHTLQATVFQSIIEQARAGNQNIAGIMLESNLKDGNQNLLENRKNLRYGVSITDPCIGWEETETLLLQAQEDLSTALTRASLGASSPHQNASSFL